MKKMNNEWYFDVDDYKELNRAFLDLKDEVHFLGFAEHWLRAVFLFIERSGYEIKKTPQAGD